MKYFVLLLLSGILLSGCKKEESVFLTHFAEKGKEKTKEGVYPKEINKQDLAILMATNEVNVPVVNIRNKYFYGYKEKLNDRYYLVEYANSYVPPPIFTHLLGAGRDIYLCIYDVEENKIISKLRIASDAPIQSLTYEEKGYVYTITSIYTEDRCKGEDCATVVTERIKVTHTYKIIENRFQLVDN